jgi:TonB family protein
LAALALLGASSAAAQTPQAQAAGAWSEKEAVALFDGRSFDAWIAERPPAPGTRSNARGRPPEVEDGIARLEPDRGWLHTKNTYRSFDLTLEFKAENDSSAGLFFRTWSRIDAIGVPANGYEVVLGDGPAPRFTGFVVAHRRIARVSQQDESAWLAVRTPNHWHRLRLRCRGDRAEVSIDDRLIMAVFDVENPTGYVGLRGDKGRVEIRRVVLTPFEERQRPVLEGLRPSETTKVVMAQLRREVKPNYTAEALEEQISGAVWMEIVIEKDGTVGDVAVVESLDPVYGLDQSAIQAVKQWRFKPASLDGQPVRMIATVEMTFTLRR